MESRDHEFLETVLWTVRAVARHLRMCCLVVGISTLAAVVVTQFVDKEYDAKAVVLPPTSSDPVAQLAGSLGSLSKIVGASPEIYREAMAIRESGGTADISLMKKNRKFQKEQLAGQGYTDIREFFNN